MIFSRRPVDRAARRRQRAAAAVAGLVVAALVGGAGVALARLVPAQWRATATIVVLPERGITGEEAASLYDTLAQGQIVGTFAEVLRVRVEAETDGPPIDVRPIADTSVIEIAASASTAAAAERRADDAFAAARADLDQLPSPYTASVVGDATGTAARTGASAPLLYAAVSAVAAGAGLGVALAVLALSRPRRAEEGLTTGQVEGTRLDAPLSPEQWEERPIDPPAGAASRVPPAAGPDLAEDGASGVRLG